MKNGAIVSHSSPIPKGCRPRWFKAFGGGRFCYLGNVKVTELPAVGSEPVLWIIGPR